MIGTEGARLLWEMRDRWDAAEGPQYVGHACLTTGHRGLILSSFHDCTYFKSQLIVIYTMGFSLQFFIWKKDFLLHIRN